MYSKQRRSVALGIYLACQLAYGAANAGTYVYVSSTEAGDISAYELDYQKQVLRPVEKFVAAKMMMPMVASHDGKRLYAITRAQPYGVYSYAIDSGSGKLQAKSVTAMPDSMVNLAIDGSGRWLIGASYGGNTLSVNRIEDDGSVSSTSTFFGASGGQRPHSLIMDRSGARLYVPHLATDEIRNYRFDPQSGMIDVPRATLVPVKPGSGPRHSVFSKDEKFLYLLTESTGEVLVFKHDSKTGSLSLVQTAASQPSNTRLVPGKPTPPMTTPVDTTSDVVDPIASADIKMTPDGRYLFTSERTLGQISRFKIDPENGEVTLLGLTATESSPRGIAIDPDSRFLVASGQNSTTLSLYAIDFQTGNLDLIGRPSVSRGANWVQIVRTH